MEITLEQDLLGERRLEQDIIGQFYRRTHTTSLEHAISVNTS